MEEFIYIIGNSQEGWYKVGASHTPGKHLSQLQTGSPVELTVVYQQEVPYAKDVEAFVHSLYKEKRLRNEWFSLTLEEVETLKADIATYVKTHPQGKAEGHLMGRNRLFNDKEKWCPGCKAWLPLDNFHNCRTQASGKKSRCKVCFKEQNSPHVRKYLYGLSDDQLMARWEGQRKGCAICREPIPFLDRRTSHIDLDPATGEVRGLLCSKCNWGLGSFKDNQVILSLAAEYLKRFEIERRERRKRGIKPVCSPHASPRRRTAGISGPSV